MTTSFAPVTAAPVRRLWAPIACGCAAVALAGVVAFVDPSEHTVLPPCPLYSTTGIHCPGCGLTRAAHAFLQGDIVTALGFNLFAPLILAGLVAGWWSWLQVARGRAPIPWHRVPLALWIVLGVAGVAFTVARNTPMFEVLAP